MAQIKICINPLYNQIFQKILQLYQPVNLHRFLIQMVFQTRMRQYQFTLIPKSSGIFIIDPFKVTFEGKTYSTRPLRVVVREGNAKQVQSTVPRRPPLFSRPLTVGEVIIPPLPQPFKSFSFLDKSIVQQIYCINDKYFYNSKVIRESVQYNVKLYRRVSLWSSISINQEDIQSVWQNNLDVIPERVVRKYGRRYYELELTKKKYAR